MYHKITLSNINCCMDFFRKLGIPGPKPGLLGAIGEYSKKGLAGFDQEMMKKYGKVVGIFHASQPIYLISDADMIKQIKVKEFQTFVNRNSSRTDFLQLLLNSHKLEMDHSEEDPDTYLEFDKTKRRGLSNAEIVGNAFIFLLAGFDTTAHALTMVADCLATNPDCQEKLIKEVDKVLNGKPPDYDSVSQLQHLENVFLETLRLYPAAVRSSRIASKDIEINGYLIKKGVDIHFPVTAIHNDPDYWRNPEKFDPDSEKNMIFSSQCTNEELLMKSLGPPQLSIDRRRGRYEFKEV